MSYEYYRKPNFGINLNSILIRVIAVNLAVFLIARIVGLFGYLLNDPSISVYFVWFLSIPADLSVLAQRPWSPITYMFLHYDLLHILFNMLWLYWFGQIFIRFTGARSFLPLYLIGGLSGALLYVISYNVFPAFMLTKSLAIAMGASASVLAIVAAISTFKPDFKINLIFFGPVSIKYIAIISVVLDVISIEKGNPGGHIAHIGGAALGFLYGMQLRNGKNIFARGGFNFRFPKIFNNRRKSRFKASSARYKTDEEYNAQKSKDQKRIDKILEKISNSGYGSLTREEKDFLFSQKR